MCGRHQHNQREYRELENYQQRVRSFNASCKLLVEYTRVQIELDSTADLTPAEIVRRRIATVQLAINRMLRQLV